MRHHRRATFGQVERHHAVAMGQRAAAAGGLCIPVAEQIAQLGAHGVSDGVVQHATITLWRINSASVPQQAAGQNPPGNAVMRVFSGPGSVGRSEENTSELQSLMRLSYSI